VKEQFEDIATKITTLWSTVSICKLKELTGEKEVNWARGGEIAADQSQSWSCSLRTWSMDPREVTAPFSIDIYT
jgi:hypothetical protein